ncbi:MAG: FAD-binding protein [Anaerolineae bacterium]|nr:FAD-binding protein [Anaerolineae bacterium]
MTLGTTPTLPEQWLEWEEKYFKRIGNTPLISLKVRLQLGQVIDDPVELLTYQTDGGVDRGAPSAVMFPYNTGDVQTLMRWCEEHNIPLIARGSGTGLAGGSVATRDGILVSFTQMKKLLKLDVEGRSAIVQPGLINQRLDEMARTAGLYFPPDPASGRATTLGGNIAANAGGPHCFKYGVTTNYITGLKVVLADGSSVQLGGQAMDYPELDFVGLLTGAEGTLGVITEANVRLIQSPPAVKTLLVAFDSIEQAGAAVSAIIAQGLIPATLEMMDQRVMNIVEGYNHPGLPTHAGAALIIDVDGYPASVEPQMEEIVTVLRKHKPLELRVARTEAERTKIWYARKSVSGALAHVAVDHYTVDGSVPRSLLAETLREVIQIGDTWDLPLAFLLHAGDGNLHPMVLIADPDDEEFMRRLRAGGREMAALFVSKNGTITGEHGVGIEKRDFMPLMHNPDELNVMREIKALFDPNGLLNPDKVLPAGEPTPKSEASGAAPVIEKTTGKPETVEEAAALISGWAATGRSICVRGGGTKTWSTAQGDAVLSTEKLRGIRHFAPEDLYLTVGAGTPLDEVQAELNEKGLWLPMLSPWPGATVGGIVSANFNAPLRMRYGGVRDLVLALTAVLPDGRIIRAGRPVMKNVAGYDLAKLFIGAHGTLGLVTDITFKLSPRPRLRQTVAIPVKTPTQGVIWGKRLAQKSLVASSILLCRGYALPDGNSEYTLLYTAEGLEPDVKTEIAQIGEVLQEIPPPTLVNVSQSGDEVWATWLRQPAAAEGYLLRLGRAPGEITETISTVLLASTEKCAILADFGSGHVYARGNMDMDKVRLVTRIHGGYTILLQSAPEAAAPQSAWGYNPEALNKMKELKALWDPRKLFNIGAFLI